MLVMRSTNEGVATRGAGRKVVVWVQSRHEMNRCRLLYFDY